MQYDVRATIKQSIREQYVEKIVKLCSEIEASEQVNELFELAKTNKDELEKKAKEFEKTSLYNKIQKFDRNLKVKPIFKKSGSLYNLNDGLVKFDERINAKALFFLIISMDQNSEDQIFENSKDLVWYLKKIGEVELARYVDKHWLYHTIARTLWEVFDEDD